MLDVLDVASIMEDAGVRKALDVLTSLSVTRSYIDLKLLIFLKSMETHTFIAAWGEFILTLEDVAVMLQLSLFVDHGATGIILIKEEERTL